MEPLIGIDPDATVGVALRGATFTVGVLDAGTWERMNHRYGAVYRDAQRRAIAKVGPENENEMAVPMEMAMDIQFREDSFHVWEAVSKLCIRGHRGLLKKDRSPVPYVAKDGVVSPETMKWYSLLPGLLEQVWYACRKLHTLEESEKKDSPPASSQTGGSSTAETAPESPASQS